MTYGENSQELRDSMAWLLGRHRILQQLGGPGQNTGQAWTDDTERERMGQIIQRYRLATLTWCLQAVTAVTPKIDLSDTSHLTQDPVQQLRYRLRDAVTTVGHGERLIDLLATRHSNQLMGAWQRTARAAALGEHDFTDGVNFGHLTSEQSRTVLKDAADLTRALVILDRRYDNVPGWQHLKEATRLGRAAAVTSALADYDGRDLSVDARGWRPLPGIIEGPALPGVAGAAQAQHNMLVHLSRIPNALNLRRVLHSQALASHEAAKHAAAVAPDLVDRFTARAELYRELVRASRDVGGLIGGGGYAVVESQNAALRLQRTPTTDASVEAAGSLRELARRFTRTDSRIRATIEHGFHEKLYFVPVNDSRLMDEHVTGVYPADQRWLPVTSPAQSPLIGITRDRLRPPVAIPVVTPEAQQHRTAYEAVVAQEAGGVGHARQYR